MFIHSVIYARSRSRVYITAHRTYMIFIPHVRIKVVAINLRGKPTENSAAIHLQFLRNQNPSGSQLCVTALCINDSPSAKARRPRTVFKIKIKDSFSFSQPVGFQSRNKRHLSLYIEEEAFFHPLYPSKLFLNWDVRERFFSINVPHQNSLKLSFRWY